MTAQALKKVLDIRVRSKQLFFLFGLQFVDHLLFFE